MLIRSLIICTALTCAFTANAQTPAKTPEQARAEIQAQMKAQQEAQLRTLQEAQARGKAAAEQAKANAAAAATHPITWLPGSEVAKGTVVGQSSGKDLLICRMPMPNKEVHSGKAWNNTCYVGFGGKELHMPLDKGEVLSIPDPVWVAGLAATNSPKAVIMGTSAGAPMHICKGKVPSGEVHPGKLWKQNCYIGFHGKELKVTPFEVLTVK